MCGARFSSFCYIFILKFSFLYQSYNCRRRVQQNPLNVDKESNDRFNSFQSSYGYEEVDSEKSEFDTILSQLRANKQSNKTSNHFNTSYHTSDSYHRRYLQAKSREDHFVTNLPGLDSTSSSKLKQYAGHLPVNKEQTGFLFYWLFEAEIDSKNG